MPKKILYFLPIFILFISALLFFPSVILANSNVTIKLDGKEVVIDVDPYIDSNGRTIVPARFVSEKLGFEVMWDGDNRRAVIADNGREIELFINSKTAYVDGRQTEMDAAAVIKNGRTMVPVRFVAETFNMEVTWIHETRTVELSSQEKDTGEDEDKIDASWEPTPPPPPEEPPPPSQPSTEHTLDSVPKTALVMKSSVNVRSSPSVDSSIIGRVNYGDWLEILSQQNRWYQVRLQDGGTGWVAGWLMATHHSSPRSSTLTPNSNPGTVIGSWNETGHETNANIPAITDIRVIEKEYGVKLHLEANSSLEKPQTFQLSGPSRVVLDFNALLGESDYLSPIEINNQPLLQLRGSQYEEDTVRIVADLNNSSVNTETYKRGDGSLEIVIEQVPPPDKTIVIDPGHGTLREGGSSDTGAVGPTGITERDVVTSISYKLGEVLINKGYSVVFTREDVTQLTLEERAKTANMSGDLFVSVHANAAPNRDAEGTETFYPRTGELIAASRTLATFIQNELLHSLNRPNRGVKQANFSVLRNSNVPAVLVEIAFVSNPYEEQLLSQEEFQEKAALAIAQGIESFIQN